MSITKQDTFQIEAKTQNFKQLGLISGHHLGQIIDNINIDLDFPLKISASFPTPDSKINFSNSSTIAPSGANKIGPPVQSQIFTDLSSLWIDFQAQTVSNPSDFEITWPISNTVGYYRVAAFKLSDTGSILVDFSDELEYFPDESPAVSEVYLTTESDDVLTTESEDILLIENVTATFNPGFLFSAFSSPIGYIKLQCTDSSGKFKTAGSASNIIENSNIFRFDCRAQSSIGDTGEANTASNIGTGEEIFKQKLGVNFEFKSLIAGSNTSVVSSSDYITISTPFGETNTASNVGTGTGLFKQKNGTDLQFKSLVAGTGVTVTPSTSSIVLSATVSGENNTASNVGTGVGIFKQKTGVNFEFKSLTASTDFFTKYSSDDNSIILAKVNYYKLGDIVESALTYAGFQASRPYGDGSKWVPLDGRSIIGSDLKNTYPYIADNLPVESRKFIKINV